MSKADSTGTRYVASGSCSWCGHKPHLTAECTSSIRTIHAETDPCP